MPKLIWVANEALERINRQIEQSVSLGVEGQTEKLSVAEQTWYDYNVMMLQGMFDDLSIAEGYDVERYASATAPPQPTMIGGRKRSPYRYLWEIRDSVGRQAHYLESLANRLDLYPTVEAAGGYVDPKRIHELQGAQTAAFNLSRLIRYCEELNLAWHGGAYLSVMMLVRAIMDHVPPLFNAKRFAEIPAEYKQGSKSFLQSVGKLQSAARDIANSYLHTHIRPKETLPTATQVDFRQQIDVLLGEVARTA